MRTTIDLPDSLLRELKSRAALRGETLKAFLVRVLRGALDGESAVELDPPRAKLPIVESVELNYDVSPDRLAEVLDEDERGVSS
jgi:hypothetical protein